MSAKKKEIRNFKRVLVANRGEIAIRVFERAVNSAPGLWQFTRKR